MKTALITGVTGQDGAYLAEFLLAKGYQVHGIKRRASLFNTARIDHLFQDPHEQDLRFTLHHGDMTDSSSLLRIIQIVQPDEIYNLAAQSHVAVSFEEPEYTANSDGIGVLRLLEAIRILGLEKKTRLYQASTSELYGLVQETPQRETTPFYPRSPYAVAKLYGYWIVVNYREAYGMYACNGILFVYDQRDAGQACHQAARESRIAAHAQHHVGALGAQQFVRAQASGAQGERQLQQGCGTLAAHTAETQRQQLDAARRHQPAFHAVGIAQPQHPPAGGAQDFGHGQPRHDVPARAARHDEDRARTHRRFPRIMQRVS